MISLKQNTYAPAAEKTLHFKHAAEMCSVSQLALSASTFELENAHRVKSEVDDINRISRAGAQHLSEPITLGVIPTSGPFLLPKVLSEVRRHHTNFQLPPIEE